MKKELLYSTILAIFIMFANCRDSETFPDPPYVPPGEEDLIPETPQPYLVSDTKFENADLSRVFSRTNPFIWYNTWTSHVVSEYQNNVSFAIKEDPQKGKVAEMTLDDNIVLSNATSWRSFIAQRIKTVGSPELYRMSFWAKKIAGEPTVRVFVKINSSKNKYFIFDTGKPETPTGKYTGYCRNIPLLTNDWEYYEFDLDFSKTTEEMGSFAYNTAKDATVEDLTNFAVCVQNNTKNSSIQFSEINLIKVSDLETTEPEPEPEPSLFVLSDPGFEEADLSKVFSQTVPHLWTDVWTSHVVDDYKNNITFTIATDPEKGKVAEMINGDNVTLSNTTSWRAFIAQRVSKPTEAELYRLSFWAKKVTGEPTVRIFAKINSSINKYFIFDTGKPETPTGKYTGYCKNIPLGTDGWTYHEYDIDFSKTTEVMGSFAYNTAQSATAEDLKNYAICIQNNTKNSSIQFDDVNLIKVSDIKD